MVQPDGLLVVAGLVVMAVGVLLVVGGVCVDQVGRLEIGGLLGNNKLVLIVM